MRFGRFDNENREYVITEPDTPLPWINYLGESEYCALISQTAGGYSFYRDPRENRILRYRYDNIPFDSNGRYLYIRDDETGKFFSPTWAPTYSKLDKYECRHGMGYTVISSECMGIETKITYFVPIGENLEVWKVEIRNPHSLPAGRHGAIRNISLFSFVEFCLWDAVGDSTNFQRTWSTGLAHCEGSTIYHTTQLGYWKDIFAYFTTSEKIHSFDCQRKEFLGDFGYGTLQAPQAVVKGQCSNSKAIGWAPIGAHCIKLKLKPGQKKTLIFILGISKKKEPRGSLAGSFLLPQKIDKELQKVKDYWAENLSKFQCETPDKDMETSLNIWNQYQNRQTFAWSRYASYYEAGIGRGMGFRDSNQDTLGFAHMIPEKVRERILALASIQFPDGSTYHQYSPLTGKGDLLGYSDDPLWLIFATANYIKETGDFSILKEKVPYAKLKGDPPIGHYPHPYAAVILKSKAKEKEKDAGSLYEHLEKAILRVYQDRGPHGLPLSKFADWNDCLNMLGKRGKAESVLVGMMLVAACREMEKLVESRKYRKIAEKIAKKISKHGWDGHWFRRAYDDSGKPVGSVKCKEGKIYLEPQPWSVMAGLDYGEAAMDSVKKLLFTKYGIKLLAPAYTKYYPELGEISTYPPGLKENASIFCHPNPWAVVAECILGRGDRAYEYYKAILPVSQNDQAEIRKTEPYVYCQMVAGPDHPDLGEGKNSWLTGSAAWNFYAASQYILGIRPEYDGLRIDPCIPREWREFKVRRIFRGACYIIKVKNPKRISRGVKFLMVDGRRIDGNLAPIFKDRKEHIIEAVLQ
jgi:cellobiose phosphorylase